MNTRIQKEITVAKETLAKLRKLYPEIPNFPLQFKKLMPRGQGYMQSAHTRGLKKKTIRLLKMVIDNTGSICFEMGYIVCHEFAHAILIHRHADTRESRKHEKLTYSLAKKMHFCS